MNKTIIHTTVSLLSALILSFLIYLSLSSWSEFISICPSKDVLSWDANLRYVAALDVFYNFRELNVFSGFLILLDSPTWPPLRTILSLVGIIISGNPDTEADVMISTFFYILLFPSMLFVLYQLNRRRIHLLPLIFLLSSSTLIFSFEIKAYSLSSMLETQGMFFLLWAVYFAYRIHPEAAGETPLKYSIYGFSFSFLGLFFTKYPYGLMLILAAVLYEIATNYRNLWDLLKLLYKNHLNIFRVIYILILAAGFAGVLIVSPEGRTGILRKIIYLSFLIVFIDFNFLYYRKYADINPRLSPVFSAMYRFGFFPALVWLGIHMDRFNSILDTQSHIQDAHRSYTLSFFNELFSLKILTILFIASLVVMIYIFVHDLRKKKYDLSKLNPVFLPIALLLGQILLMEVLTGNKQLRHIYHLIPALSVFLFSLNPFPLREEQNLIRFRYFLAAAAATLFLIFYTFFEQKKQNPPLCFTGMDKKNYDAPRFFASSITPEQKYLLFNNFHMEPFPLHGYAISTDFDILIYRQVFPGGFISRFSKRKEYSSNSFDSVIYVSRDCSLSADFQSFIKKFSLSLKLKNSLTHPETGFCMNEFSVEKKP
ncbi:MAG: hypothetical protein OEZ34_10610 [Spirochaetia bacterium]|nr:hypothetical protein [Spirochaetia bacterium]